MISLQTGMARWARGGAVALVGFSILLGAGCGKKAAPTAAEPAPAAEAAAPAPKLSGAAEVNAALDRKDYDAAIAALLRIRQAANTDEKQVQFMALSREVKMRLQEAEATDPKASEGLAVLRGMTLGR